VNFLKRIFKVQLKMQEQVEFGILCSGTQAQIVLRAELLPDELLREFKILHVGKLLVEILPDELLPEFKTLHVGKLLVEILPDVLLPDELLPDELLPEFKILHVGKLLVEILPDVVIHHVGTLLDDVAEHRTGIHLDG
jgi:hypothetical protein